MAQIAKWNERTFLVEPGNVRSFRDISITASCETEDAVMDGEKYVKRKNGKPWQISLTAIFDSRVASYGGGVQSAALELCNDAYNSSSGYFYIGTAKLFPMQLMATEAKVQDVSVGLNGEWVSCNVAMTFKQSSKYNGTVTPGKSGDGSGGASKQTTKTQSLTASQTDAVKKGAQGVAIALATMSAAKQTSKIINDANSTTGTKPKANVKFSIGGSLSKVKPASGTATGQK